ncbi:MAG: putative lipid II flippase FtsW [Alicyclobacillaceae bacterium]|nr:putative lipid II flippase FtsW [Alicyclobacillaceae bacterium]
MARVQKQYHQPDFVLYFTVLALTAIGIITVYSASTVISLENGMSATHFASRQLFAGGLGVIAMTALMFVPYQFFYKHAAKIIVVAIFLLFIVLIPGIGSKASGSRRWIGASGLHLQPSEFAIVALILYLAFFFTKKVTLLQSFKQGLRPALMVITICGGLVLLEPDLGTAFTMIATGFVLVFASGIRLKPILISLGIATPLLYIFVHMAKYRSNRLMVYFHPFRHPQHAYQLINGLTGISAGGWFGRGFDMSVEKAGYLPIPQADFIFAVFTEEWGFVGAAALLAIFGVLIWRGFRISRYSRDRFGALLSVGITGLIVIETFVNLGAVTWLLPVTGIPLPFISYGGTSLLVLLIASGLLLSVSRQTLDEAPEADELADVVYVEDVLQQRVQRPEPRRAKTSNRTSGAPRKSPTAKAGKVEPIRREQPSRWGTKTTDTANHRERSKNSSARPSATVQTTWRQRNQAYSSKSIAPKPTPNPKKRPR